MNCFNFENKRWITLPHYDGPKYFPMCAFPIGKYTGTWGDVISLLLWMGFSFVE